MTLGLQDLPSKDFPTGTPMPNLKKPTLDKDLDKLSVVKEDIQRAQRKIITIEEGQSLEEVIMTTSFSRPTISASTPDILPRPDFSGYRLLEAGERRESLEYTRKTTR